jgi:hypothetical protein
VSRTHQYQTVLWPFLMKNVAKASLKVEMFEASFEVRACFNSSRSKATNAMLKLPGVASFYTCRFLKSNRYTRINLDPISQGDKIHNELWESVFRHSAQGLPIYFIFRSKLVMKKRTHSTRGYCWGPIIAEGPHLTFTSAQTSVLLVHFN